MAILLPTLPMGGFAGTTPEQQQIWWQEVVAAISAQEARQDETLADIQALQADQATIIADIQALQTEQAAVIADIQALQADQAAVIASLQKAIRDHAISVSYTAPGEVLSAADAGSDVTITIVPHTRVYGDISNVAVDGGTITSVNYSAARYVYYDDPERDGGAVTYFATDNANVALPSKAEGRHFVGRITTPGAGGGATSGGTAAPSGGGGVGSTDITAIV